MMKKLSYFPDVKSKALNQLSGHRACIYALGGPIGPYDFVSGGGDALVAGWKKDQPEQGQLIARTSGQVFALCTLPDKQLVLAGTMQGMLHWLPIGKGQPRHVQAHKGAIFAILPIGKYILTAGEDGDLNLWDVDTSTCSWQLHLATRSLRTLDYYASRNEIAVGASDHNIYLLDAEDFSIRHCIESAHDNSVFTVRYVPHTTWLLSGGRDAQLKRWVLADSPTVHQTVPAHMFTINSIAVHPSGKYIATGSRDKTIRLWDSEQLTLLKGLERVRDRGHAHSVNALRWLDERHLVSASDDRTLILWAIEA